MPEWEFSMCRLGTLTRGAHHAPIIHQNPVPVDIQGSGIDTGICPTSLKIIQNKPSKPKLHSPTPLAKPRRLELNNQREVELIDGAEHFPLPVPQPQAMNVGKLYPIPFVPAGERQV